MQISWQHTVPQRLDTASSNIKEYLLFTGSLTQKISDESNGKFSLTVLANDWQTLCVDESQALSLNKDEQGFIREVLIYADELPVIYAKTIFPAETLNETNTALKQLGNQSLGDILFKSDNCSREYLEYATLDKTNALYKRIEQHSSLHNQENIFARRSLFLMQEKPLLVLEAFLPDLATIK